MKLILGGYANGRTAYAMQKYHLTESDCFDAAVQSLTQWQGQRLILHAEQLAVFWLAEGESPCTAVRPWLERWHDAICITQEVGCGLVPITAEQRQQREAIGRFNTFLAKHAETVERVCCGIGMMLKGA